MKGLDIPAPAEDFTADPVELFFDLAYVFAFSQLVVLLLEEPNWTGVGRAALVFVLLWLPWSQITWAANAVAGNSRFARLTFLAATAASVPMAASVSTAFDQGGLLLAVPLSFITLTGLSLVIYAARGDDEAMRAARNYGIPLVLAIVVILIGGVLEDEARVVAWIIGILIFLVNTVMAGGEKWVMRAGHFAERHGLIVIVALGEVIVAVGKPLVDSLEEGEGFPAASVLALAAAGVFACLLWWAYFDRPQPAFEHRMTQIEDDAERAQMGRDLYTYVHAPMVAGVILSAAAIEEIALHPSDPLPLAFRLMLLAGLALFLGGVGIGVIRAYGVLPKERSLAAFALAALLLLGEDLDGVYQIVLIDVTIFVVLLAEHLRIEGGGSNRRVDVEVSTG